MTLRVGSLFSGIGGFDLGLERAGGRRIVGAAGLACREEGLRCVGIEREEPYLAIAVRRLGPAATLMLGGAR